MEFVLTKYFDENWTKLSNTIQVCKRQTIVFTIIKSNLYISNIYILIPISNSSLRINAYKMQYFMTGHNQFKDDLVITTLYKVQEWKLIPQ